MPAIDFAALAQPISEAEPCGPDLDLAGDADFLNFMANAEGALPASFFKTDPNTDRTVVFDPTSIDFDAQFDKAGKLLEATRDLRLLVTVAKLLILSRDIERFSASMSAVAQLLQERWESVHPSAADDGGVARSALLSSLDDMPTVVLPLQHFPLVESKRHGTFAFRAQMIATGEIKPRAGEQAPDSATMDKALGEADLDRLVALRTSLVTLRTALRRIRDTAIERSGFENAPTLDRLPPLVDKMAAFLEAAIVRRDPSLIQSSEPEAAGSDDGAQAEPSGGAEAAGPSLPRGRIANVTHAAEALAAVAAYFNDSEPSSPALLLVRQAQQLIGKSFVEVMRILIPARVPHAKVSIGSEPTFSLQLEGLSTIAATGGATARPDSPAAPGSPEPAGGNGAEPWSAEVRTRRDAVAFLDDVGAFYRAMEPSSPIPLLTDRARSLIERDFLYLLKDLLPEPEPAPPPKK